MTALSGPILIDSATGSDSLSSGLGPATRINDVTEGTTASYSGTTITFSGATDLSGVSAGDLLNLHTSTGVQWFAIASVNDGADTLTIDKEPTGTASGLSWAIGGRLASLNGTDPYKLIDNGGSDGDSEPGWIIEFSSGHTETSTVDYDLRGSGSNTLGRITIRGEADAATKPIISFSSDTFGFIQRGAAWSLKDFTIRSTGAKSGTNSAIKGSAGPAVSTFEGLTIESDSGTNDWVRGIRDPISAVIHCNDISGCDVGIEVQNSGTSQPVKIIRNHIHDCSSHGIDADGGASFGLHVDSNIVEGNGGIGILIDNARTDNLGSATIVTRNSIEGNTGDAIEIQTWNASNESVIVQYNIIGYNTGIGLNISNGSASDAGSGYYFADSIRGNAFISNTGGNYNNIVAHAKDTVLTADPWTARGSGDYSINNTSGGGEDLRAVTEVIGSTTFYPFNELAAPVAGGGGTSAGRQGLHAIESGSV